MIKSSFGSLVVAAVAFATMTAVPAYAGRTAIDQRDNPDGTTSRITTTLSGYCDIQGEDCGGGMALGYDVSFDGGANFFNNAIVQGNGLLTFGQAVDFETPVGSDGDTLASLIYGYTNPALLDYQRTLVSVGQRNTIDDFNEAGKAFLQSASLKVVNQVIIAEFFTCSSPRSSLPEDCFNDNVSSLMLKPTATGFFGTIKNGFDQAYVVDGRQVNVGRTFFLPATIRGVTSAVPEPATWAMMIVGFGIVGGAMRRRTARTLPAVA